MEQSQIIDIYINKVQQELYNLSPADPFLTALREELIDYVLNFPDCTLEDLIDQFGPPEITAKDFLENVIDTSPKELARKKKKRKIIIAVLAILLAAVVIYCIIISMQTQSMSDDTITIYDGTKIKNTSAKIEEKYPAVSC